MKCNVTDCYWNMWSPKHPMFDNEEYKQCVSEDLQAHFDVNDEFAMTPNSRKCAGYLSYLKFCGVEKGEDINE